jgi:hypothetical protein
VKDVASLIYSRSIGEHAASLASPAGKTPATLPPHQPPAANRAAPQQREAEDAWALFTIRLAHLVYGARLRVLALLALLSGWGQHPALAPARRTIQDVAAAAGLGPPDDQGAALLAVLGLAAGALLLLRLAAVLLDSRAYKAGGGGGAGGSAAAAAGTAANGGDRASKAE